MKIMTLLRTIVLPVVGLSLVAGCTSTTAQPVARQTRGGLIFDNTERSVVLTGSRIPQRVRVQSIGTDSVHNVRIVTKDELQSANGGFGVGGLSSVIGR